MSTGVRDRAPAPLLAPEQSERRPVMLVSLDIGFDETAIEMAIEAALEANSELLVCLGVQLPVGNANAAARRTMGDPVVREQIREILAVARAAGAKAQMLVYNSPRPISATIGVAQSRRVGLVVFGPNRKRYGRWRFRLHARRLRRGIDCLFWPFD
ncbi:MAG: hypothetical protein ACR2J9_11985 [Gaiellales bacterium]